jgi:hypothetical protein
MGDGWIEREKQIRTGGKKAYAHKYGITVSTRTSHGKRPTKEKKNKKDRSKS